jgi:hypothetical protein
VLLDELCGEDVGPEVLALAEADLHFDFLALEAEHVVEEVEGVAERLGRALHALIEVLGAEAGRERVRRG